MRILVTGAAGFVGSHLCDRLHAAGHDVCGVDNLQTGRESNVGDWQFCKGDIASVEWALASLHQPDVIIHCAASYDDRDKWHRDTTTNVQGAINVAIAARETGAQVIYMQTALIYGNNPYPQGIVPWPLPTDAPLAPQVSYAISKLAAEQYLRLADVPLLTLRLANIYGPRNLSGPVPTFYKRLSEGQQCTIVDSRRDFVYIQDLVELVDQAINENAAGTFHVSTGRDYAIGQMYECVVDALDAHGTSDPVFQDRGPDDSPTILLDPSQTKARFGWQATTDLDEGITAAVDWYREHGVTDTYTHLAVRG